MKCVLIELFDCPYSQGRVLYTVINQVAGNTSGWDVWGLNFNISRQRIFLASTHRLELLSRYLNNQSIKSSRLSASIQALAIPKQSIALNKCDKYDEK